MKIKHLIAIMSAFVCSIPFCNAHIIPPMRNINRVSVKFLPDAINRQVKFSFDKQDLNGYSGSDAVVFTVTAPSGKAVWEVSCPDDGNDRGGEWKLGPRQRVICTFIPQEKGVYTLKANTASEMDIQILFDNARAKNTAWGLEVSSARFSNGRLDVAIALPPQNLGEKREQIIELCTVRRSKITNFRINTENIQVVAPFSMPLHSGEKTLVYHKLQLNRQADQDIYEFTADDFSDVVSMQLPNYGSFMIFPEKRFANNFLSRALEGAILELKVPGNYPEMAFERGCRYQISYQSGNRNNYDFAVTIFGRQYRFTQQTANAQFTVPVDCAYSTLIADHVPTGKFQITRMTNTAAVPLQPTAGVILATPEPLIWSAVTNAKNYTVKFTSIVSGQSFEMNASVNCLMPQDFTHKLSAGVWAWAVKSDNGKFGKQSFFAIKQVAFTQLPYIYNMNPAMDSTVVDNINKISFQLALLKGGDLDFIRSRAKINGKEFRLAVNGTDSIATAEPIIAIHGRNNVELKLIDHHGNRSDFKWGFFVGNPDNPPNLTHDKNGNIYFCNTPFYPVIYYGYQYPRLEIEKFGFNTALINTLSSENILTCSLARNIKVLDSGSVYQGFYSKDKSIVGAEADVKAFAASPMAVHPARLGAWMDEIDVHRSLDYIKNFLAYFGPSDRGWRGVCSCNRALYDSMTKIGDYLMIDYYSSGKDLFALDDACKAGRKAAGEKPLMILVSGFSQNDPKLTGFIPTNKDVTYAAFAALRLKANALGLYQCGEYRLESYKANWEHAGKVYRQVAALSFITYGKDVQNAVKVISTGGKVNFRAIEYNKVLYLIAQNCSFDSAIANIKLDRPFNGKAKVLFEDRIIDVVNGKWVDCFGGADTHIYAIDLP